MIDLFDNVPEFVAVVEAGNFSAAAEKLHLSRSAVGKAIARLESRLGVRLFQRTTRSQRLTDDGQSFYEHCETAIAALQAGKARLETDRKTVSGTLRVSMPTLFGRKCVAPIMTDLARANPDLKLDLDFRDAHVDLVDAGIDLAVRNGPIGVGTGLMAKRVGRKRTFVCASPSYVQRRGVPGTLDDLAEHEAVIYSRDGRALIWRFPRPDGPARELTPPTRLRLNDLDAMLDAVRAGLGLAWLPDWLISEDLATGVLVRLLENETSQMDDVHVIWPETTHLPTRVRVAIDALATGLARIGRD